jgi:hypothetical protein
MAGEPWDARIGNRGANRPGILGYSGSREDRAIGGPEREFIEKVCVPLESLWNPIKVCVPLESLWNLPSALESHGNRNYPLNQSKLIHRLKAKKGMVSY